MAKNLVFRKGVKVLGNLPLGTGQELLTRDTTTKEVGATPPLDSSTFLTTSLQEGYILIGNSSDTAQAVLPVGDVTITPSGVTSISPDTIMNVHVKSNAAIQYSKLNLTGSIINSDIAAGAAISRSKLATGTPYRVIINNDVGVMSDAAAITGSRVLISDANGIPVHSTTTLTTLSYLDVTSSIQTSLDNKLQFSSAITPVEGDLITYTGGQWTRLGIGTSGQLLSSNGTNALWVSDPPNGLPAGGTTNQYLRKINNTDYNVEWDTLTISDVTDIVATAAEINKLSGVTTSTAQFNFLNTTVSDVQVQLNQKMTNLLPHNAMFVGNVSNVASVLLGGTSGQVLTISGTTPTWQTLTGTGTVTSIDVSGGTTGMTFTGGPVSTSGVITMTGTLAPTNGGTGQATYTVGDLLYSHAVNNLTKLAIGTTGQVLVVSGGNIPSWDTIPVLSDGDKGDITVSGATTVWTVDADINKVWTGTHSWRDNNWSLVDNGDITKVLNLQLSGITTGTTRTITIPDKNGTLVVTTDLQATIELVNLTTHGFVVGDALKKGATVSSWAILDGTADSQGDLRGIVLQVTDANNFVVALPGSRVTGLTGLTAGQVNYAQSDGSLGGTVTNVQVLYADSTTTGYILAGGAGGGGVGTPILTANFDGQGSVVLVNTRTYFRAKGGGTLSGWSIIAEGTSPTCTIDVWRVGTGTVLPNVANTIMGTKPALTTGNAIESTSMVGWNTAFVDGDIFCVNIDAAANATKINFALYV